VGIQFQGLTIMMIFFVCFVDRGLQHVYMDIRWCLYSWLLKFEGSADAHMTVESIQATYIVYKYITLLWTD